MFDLAPTLPGTIGAVSVPGSAAVIGDIHGRADLLRRLLKQLPAGFPVFVVGDICDRGPDTRACIDLLVEAGARGYAATTTNGSSPGQAAAVSTPQP